MADPERHWKRYWGIRDDHRNGYRMPILRHLALRRDPMAMMELASEIGKPGNAALPFSSAGLYHRAYRMGYSLAAQHLAMDAFNRRDQTGYRVGWLGRRLAVILTPRGDFAVSRRGYLTQTPV